MAAVAARIPAPPRGAPEPASPAAGAVLGVGEIVYECGICLARSAIRVRLCMSCGALQEQRAITVPSKPRTSAVDRRRAEARRLALLDDGALAREAAKESEEDDSDRVPLRAFRLSEIDETIVERMPCGEAGLDRVFGGGLVRGRTYVLFGPPGCGKSRFMLAASTGLCQWGTSIYACHPDEEEEGDMKRHLREGGHLSLPHVKERFRLIPNAVDVDAIMDVIERAARRPKGSRGKPGTGLAGFFIDSGSAIGASFANGAVTLRYVFASAKMVAKSTDSVGFILCHENKLGKMAGSQFLQHAVSGAVLQVERMKKIVEDGVASYVPLPEKERSNFVRFVTTGKNRFADATQIAIYEHTPTGLKEVEVA